jgi:uncharacterized protein (DUF488 family)
MTAVYTVGHSNHSEQAFVRLLQDNGITAIADVRSSPYSRFNPQFNREALIRTLRAVGIAYVFLGAELGARSEDGSCYDDGKVQYDRLAKTDVFKRGLERVVEGSGTYCVALMCAEKDPLDCHRTILVARHLVERGLEVKHVLAGGAVETHDDAVRRLLQVLSLPEQDMFRSREDIITDAYAIRGQAIAYDRNTSGGLLANGVEGDET